MPIKIKTTMGALKKDLSQFPDDWPVLIINGGKHNITDNISSIVYLLTVPYIEKNNKKGD